MASSSNRPRLSVFAASNCPPKSPLYADVQALGKAIAKQGWDGLTGGHVGLMAAFAEGMHASGAHMRGITLDCFPTPKGHCLHDEQDAPHFFERMRRLIEEADAYLVLPGGLGTLAELAMCWDLLSIGLLAKRPLMLYGQDWQEMIAVLQKHLLLSKPQAFDQLVFCTSADDVLKALEQHHV